MKKSISTLLPILLLLVSCATPQAGANTQVPSARTATPSLSQFTETPAPSAIVPSVQLGERRWTSFSSRSNKFAVFTNSGSLCVYQIVNEKTLVLEQLWGTILNHEVNSMALSPDGNLLVIVLDGVFIVWIDASNGNFLHVFRGTQMHPNPHLLLQAHYPLGIAHAVFSPDGKWLAVLNGNSNGSLTLWDTETAEIGQIVNFNRSDEVRHVAFTDDSTQLAATLTDDFIAADNTLYTDVRIYTWSLLEQMPLRIEKLPSSEGGTSYLDISPDGRLVVFGMVSEDKVFVWDLLQELQLFVVPVARITEYGRYMHYLTFSPDGETLFTMANDQLIAWDIATGTETGSYPSGPRSDFSLSLDGKSLLLSDGTTLSLWETDSGKQLASTAFPNSAKITTDTFQSLPALGIEPSLEMYNFYLTLPPVQIDAIKMIDATTGWGNATNGRLYRTTDGGQQWQDVNPDDHLYTWDDFFALDAVHAWAVTNDFLMPIWYTSDGGQTWEKPQEFPFDPYLFTYTISLQFTDAQTGWYLGAELGNHGGSNGYLYMTHDGGKTWEQRGSMMAFWNYEGIFFYDQQIAFMYGTNGTPSGYYGSPLARDFIDGKLTPYLEMTADGGQTWETVSLPRLSPIPEEIRALYSSDVRMECNVPDVEFESTSSRRILAHVACEVEYQGYFDFDYFSDDGGQTWKTQQYVPKDNPIHDFVNPLTGWQQIKAQDGQMYHLQQTLDGGKTWNTIADVDWEAYELNFVDEQTGWAITYRGDFTVLLHTTDGGKTWEEISPLIVP